MSKTKSNHSYICNKCGYKAVELGKLSKCPLCKVCARCRKPVRECTCIEGE